MTATEIRNMTDEELDALSTIAEFALENVAELIADDGFDADDIEHVAYRKIAHFFHTPR